LKKCPPEAIDELVEMAQEAEEKNKLALIDLLRLLVLENSQADYILGKHWDLVDLCICSYL
jgi:hypothetical protein